MNLKMILLICFISFSCFFGQSAKPNLVVYYFGESDCSFCNDIKCINGIKQLHKEFPKLYKDDYNIKFVLACTDTDIKKGLKFISKYGYWDDISIGSHYKNELAMNYLNKTKLPGMPHILVFEDVYENESTPVIKDRKILVNLVGTKQITEWVNNKYPLH